MSRSAATVADIDTPKKSTSPEICRVCASYFPQTRDKHNLFRSSYGLAAKLGEATGCAVTENDGLPQFVCSCCRSKLLRFDRIQRELEESRRWFVDKYQTTKSRCRFKRTSKESPTCKPSSKKATGLTAIKGMNRPTTGHGKR